MASAIEKKPNLWSTEALSFSGTRQAKLAQGKDFSFISDTFIRMKTQLIKIS